MTLHRSLACLLATIATCAAIGLVRERAVAAPLEPATRDATTYFIPPSFDIGIEPPASAIDAAMSTKAAPLERSGR